MKKLTLVLVVLLIAAGMVMADVTVGGWGRIEFGVTGNNTSGSKPMVVAGPGWAGGGRVGIAINGSSDNVGFSLNINSNGGSIGIGDNANIWIKFNDIVMLTLGQAQEDSLRGKVGDIYGAMTGGDQDSIFMRAYPKKGAVLKLTPVSGLTAILALDTDNSTTTLEDAFKYIYAGVGYVIDGVGFVRLGYNPNDNQWGTAASSPVADNTFGYLNFAFQLTAVEGLNADLGVKYNLANTVAGDTVAKVALGATYGMDAFGATLRVDTAFQKDDSNSDTSEFDLNVATDLNYSLDIATFGVVLASNNLLDTANAGTGKAFQVQPYVKKGYSNGYVRLGVNYLSMLDTGADPSSVWTIFTTAEYWF
ncbi:hypothetical protein WKV44_02255 [Spirochaetia bacterium 38H-sp]|uniref:Porin n=1 Tax=Rarispira pelagica TaxID=3141764 RepID=A0ABU9UA67_9SPIR